MSPRVRESDERSVIPAKAGTHREDSLQPVVKGSIFVEKGRDTWFTTSRTPLVKIGAGAVVSGTLTFEREVRLEVDPTAKIGAIAGVKPISVSNARSSAVDVEK